MEFTGLHQKTTPISIGIVADDGRIFYAEFNDFDKYQVDDWIMENVIENLKFEKPNDDENEPYTATRHKNNLVGNNLYNSYSLELRGDKTSIVSELHGWLGQFDEVEMWSDVLGYDWVLFCELFGGAFGIPKNVYYIPFDITTLMRDRGIDPDINREEMAQLGDGEKHNALWDARVIRACYINIINRDTAK